MPTEKKKTSNTLGGSFGYPKPAPKPTPKKGKGKKGNDVVEKTE